MDEPVRRRVHDVALTDKEIEAIQFVTALAVVQANNGKGPKIPHLLSAVIKIGKSKYDSEIEIPEERLRILE